MKTLTTDFAKSFAERWLSSWNSHNINKILSNYSEDFIIESRIALKLIPGSKGIIVGKKAVKEYWLTGLEQNKNLEFKMLDVLIGINGISIYYINVATKLRAAETMIFNEERKVQKAFVYHSD